MAKRIPRSFLAIALFVILPYLVGCGGGSSTPPPINDQLFVPNYVSSLEGLFHWNHLPMTVAVYLPTNWAQIYPSNQNLYIDAANEWNQPGMQPLVNVVPPGSPADATITFVKQSELGDKTQLAVIALAAKLQAPLEIILGVTAAFLVLNGVAVIVGEKLARVIPMRWVKRSAGILFIVIGALILLNLL